MIDNLGGVFLAVATLGILAWGILGDLRDYKGRKHGTD